MWAGRAWATGALGQKRDRMVGARADAALIGLVLVGEWDNADDEDGVWPENEGAVHAFLEICSQFRTVAHFDGSLQRTGLDYPAVETGLRLAEVPVNRELWEAIRLIEWGVLSAPVGGEA